MAQDDWRIHIRVERGEHAGGLLERLGGALGSEARELARELAERRLAVSRDGETIFVYAASKAAAQSAKAVVDAELRDLEIEASESGIEHWLADEDRWDDEPRGETWEEDELARGYAPWEVQAQCASRKAAETLAATLEQEGYSVVRRWRYLTIGTATKEDAEELAKRVHGEVEPGGEVIREVTPGNPFAIFGGLAG